MTEQVFLIGILNKKYCLCYPKNSFVITLAQQIFKKSSSLYKHIRNAILLLLLPDQHIIFNQRQCNIMSIYELTRFNDIYHLAILQQLSSHIKYNYDKVLVLHIDEINITLQLIFQNRHLFVGVAYNNPVKEATNMLVFLLLHPTNYQQPINAMSISVTALDSNFLK